MLNDERHLFDIPDHITYLNTAGASPLLKSVRDAGLEGIDVKVHPWQITNEHFWDRLWTCRELFSKLIFSGPEDVAIVPSATYGVETAVRHALERSLLVDGSEVLVQSEEFPALILPLTRLAQKTNARLVTVPTPTDHDWTEKTLDQINERTRIVALGLHHWTDGAALNIKPILEKAKKFKAQVWLDACQSLGATPFPVPAEEFDYIFAPTYKWLLGPYAFGFLFVNKKHQNLSPLEEYWAGRIGSEDFSKLTVYEKNYRSGAIRFDMSERSQFIHVPMAIAALKQIIAWTPERIAQTLKFKTGMIAEAALAKGYQAPSEKFRAPHFIGLRRSGGFDESFKSRLEKEHVYVSFRGDCLRIAPHLFNTSRDLERLIQLL